jgi:hypothetical protein
MHNFKENLTFQNLGISQNYKVPNFNESKYLEYKLHTWGTIILRWNQVVRSAVMCLLNLLQ